MTWRHGEVSGSLCWELAFGFRALLLSPSPRPQPAGMFAPRSVILETLVSKMHQCLSCKETFDLPSPSLAFTNLQVLLLNSEYSHVCHWMFRPLLLFGVSQKIPGYLAGSGSWWVSQRWFAVWNGVQLLLKSGSLSAFPDLVKGTMLLALCVLVSC